MNYINFDKISAFHADIVIDTSFFHNHMIWKKCRFKDKKKKWQTKYWQQQGALHIEYIPIFGKIFTSFSPNRFTNGTNAICHTLEDIAIMIERVNSLLIKEFKGATLLLHFENWQINRLDLAIDFSFDCEADEDTILNLLARSIR